MADYYTQSVVKPDLVLTPDQKAALEAHGASCDETNGLYYVYFEDGWQDAEEADGIVEEELWRDILMGNPDVEMILVESAFTCSKMRSDGFGGSSLFITRTEHVSVGSQCVILRDGHLVVELAPTKFDR